MPTATRTADSIGAADLASEAVAVGVHDLPLVIIDLERARRHYRALRDDFPWVDVHYDVSALAHPALLAAIADAGGGFEVTHDQALPALLLAGSAGHHVLHATPVAHPHEVRAAYDAGVRRFVVDGARALEVFAGAPDDLQVVLKLQPALAPRPAHRAAGGMSSTSIVAAARAAHGLGMHVAGLSLTLPDESSPAEYVSEIVRAIGVAADVDATTGQRLRLLDLGDGFPGRADARPQERAELARAIRGIVAPATSRVDVTASAGHAVTAGCLTVVAGAVRRDVEPAVASACIDAGAEVVVLDAQNSSLLKRLPLLRSRGASEHRVLRRAART
jgi:diaminopimelate decarboxylase